MKWLTIALVIGLSTQALAITVRERAEGLLQRFNGGVVGEVVTNGEDCVLTTVDDSGEYRFCYSLEGGVLNRVLLNRHDGGVDCYEYGQGKVLSALYTSADVSNARSFAFVGDGKGTNSVDCIEFKLVGGKSSGSVRLYDIMGREINRPLPKRSSWWVPDIEFIPSPGMRARIGPYEWIVVDDKYTTMLSRNGKIVLKSDCWIGGKYPWIVGIGRESTCEAARQELSGKGLRARDEYVDVVFYFVLDVRDDHVVYIAENAKEEIERITGQNLRSYAKGSFWYYVLSKRGPERLAKLEEALKPPTAN